MGSCTDRLRRDATVKEGLACEQALHLGDVVKSRLARGTREDTRKRVLARLALHAQTGELARRLKRAQDIL